MEKIKRALEKAREERGDPSFIKSQKRKPQKDPSAPPVETQIKYSQTKVLDANEEHFSRNGLINGLENDPITTAYKILRTQVEQRMVAQGWNTLAVTSANQNEGKTQTAINLAISLAREMHRTVLLVDLDLRNPNIHKRLGHAVDQGVADYLLNGVPLANLMFNPGVERLVVLPGSAPIEGSSELLASPSMESLVSELKTRYPSRFVIFDLPPLLSTDDALAFVPAVDAVLLIAEDGKTKQSEFARSLEMLQRTNLMGTVLNKSSETLSYY